jgi:site-specific recombinase XerD
MTRLRQRTLHELQRRNYSPSTIRGYLGAVRQFAEHFHCSPEQLGAEHLRRYQRYLLQEKKLEPSTVEMRISALRFLYKRTLKRLDSGLRRASSSASVAHGRIENSAPLAALHFRIDLAWRNEKPIASILAPPHQRLPSNRSIRPAPHYLHPLRTP